MKLTDRMERAIAWVFLILALVFVSVAFIVGMDRARAETQESRSPALHWLDDHNWTTVLYPTHCTVYREFTHPPTRHSASSGGFIMLRAEHVEMSEVRMPLVLTIGNDDWSLDVSRVQKFHVQFDLGDDLGAHQGTMKTQAFAINAVPHDSGSFRAVLDPRQPVYDRFLMALRLAVNMTVIAPTSGATAPVTYPLDHTGLAMAHLSFCAQMGVEWGKPATAPRPGRVDPLNPEPGTDRADYPQRH